MCWFAFQATATSRWLVQIVEGPFILLLLLEIQREGLLRQQRKRVGLLQTVNGGAAA